jgi:MFS family permease
MAKNEPTSDARSKMLSFGFWSAVVFTVAVIFSGITATAAWKTPSLISGIILVPIFTVLMTCIHDYAPEQRKLFSRLGMLFTIGYAVLIGFNYFMQLTLVRQDLYAIPFDMSDPKSIMWVIEILGYGFMGLATFFAAWVFNSGKLENAVRWLFIANGVMGIGGMIGYALGLSMDIMYGGLVLWDIIMPVTSILLAILFKRAQKTQSRAPIDQD